MQVMGAVADVRSGEIVESETAMQDRMQGWRPQKENEERQKNGRVFWGIKSQRSAEREWLLLSHASSRSAETHVGIDVFYIQSRGHCVK